MPQFRLTSSPVYQKEEQFPITLEITDLTPQQVEDACGIYRGNFDGSLVDHALPHNATFMVAWFRKAQDVANYIQWLAIDGIYPDNARSVAQNMRRIKEREVGFQR